MPDTFYGVQTGKYRSPELPAGDLSRFPELVDAVGTAARLEAEHQQSLLDYGAAEQALQEAIASDRAALAAAKLSGAKKLPRADSVEAAKAALEEARRQLDAADDARRRAAEIVVEVLDAHRQEWLPIAQELAEKARAAEAKALEQYLATVEETTRAHGLVSWIARFPQKGAMKNVTPGLQHVTGDPIPWPDLMYGLSVRAGLADPPPRTLREQVEARGLVPAPEIGGPARSDAA